MSELETITGKLVSVVPYFFYDLFGRMLPGLFLFCGAFLGFRNNNQLQEFVNQAHSARTAEWVIGCAILVAGIFLIGFLLAAVTHLVWWLLPGPMSLARLRDQFGSSDRGKSSIETAFARYFGFRLDQRSESRAYLVYCSRLCQLAVASRHPALDSVSMRVDAEELLSRSLCAASLILLIVSATLREWFGCAAYLAIGGLSFRLYWHYRLKGFRERFQMFLVLFRDPTKDEPPSIKS